MAPSRKGEAPVTCLIHQGEAVPSSVDAYRRLTEVGG